MPSTIPPPSSEAPRRQVRPAQGITKPPKRGDDETKTTTIGGAGPDEDAPDWFELEPPIGRLWVIDLQRLKRRAKTRLLLIFAITFALTGMAARKFSKRGASYDATVFIAFDESALSSGRNSVPGRELTQYVSNVLITDKGLAELANRRNLHPLRKKLGDEYAINELRMQMELESIQNDYAERRVAETARTATVQITVYGESPEEATMLANDIAEIAVTTSHERAIVEARALADDVERTVDNLRERVTGLSREMLSAKNELAEARASGDQDRIAEASVQFEQADAEWRRADTALTETTRVSAMEASAEALQRAGLGINARIIDGKNAGGLVDMRTGIAIAVIFVFFGSLVAVSLLVAAFDSRIHDADDISRLGLPVLGQVPDFPGQTMGSLRQRGVRRHRVPSFLRWLRS